MSALPEQLLRSQTLWAVAGAFSMLLFFAGIVIFTLMYRQKRRGGASAALLVVVLAYGLFQWIAMGISHADRFRAPNWLIVLLCAALTLGEAILFIGILTRRNRITPMSIKEATDSLPMGILCCAPNGKILLINAMMEHFCTMLFGDVPTNGSTVSERLRNRAFRKDCQVIYDNGELALRVADGTAWTVTQEIIPCDGIGVRAFMASDITEIYSKTVELRKIREQTQAANERLVKINREIIALTVEQELLDAQVRIHDEMGSNLLAIKKFILYGGTEAEKAEIEQRVRENIGFLQRKEDAEQDEYDLLIGTAKKLGVDVVVHGQMPQEERLKKIILTGMHECFTNVLRHAHGNRLDVRIEEEESKVVVTFTNNGNPPKGPIREQGGLVYLRSRTEQAGGSMTVRSMPELAITLELPKE